MNVEVELPDLGPEGGDHGTVAEWHFDEGDWVEEGEILVEVLAELENVDVPSPCTGRLIERIVEEDEIVRAGEPVAIIDCPDEEMPLPSDEA